MNIRQMLQPKAIQYFWLHRVGDAVPLPGNFSQRDQRGSSWLWSASCLPTRSHPCPVTEGTVFSAWSPKWVTTQVWWASHLNSIISLLSLPNLCENGQFQILLLLFCRGNIPLCQSWWHKVCHWDKLPIHHPNFSCHHPQLYFLSKSTLWVQTNDNSSEIQRAGRAINEHLVQLLHSTDNETETQKVGDLCTVTQWVECGANLEQELLGPGSPLPPLQSLFLVGCWALFGARLECLLMTCYL